ncbi:hypothetical protein Nepgr_024807 [Nepenthes gracilis]|uniref:Uncharacterized protein n=1 Tax=Nepenthes gracilis TaxID=150966 RepID=A0AAD3Y0E2_NEPGR|nr:hypothetical protein Nepgr_024807 [Nepenthes gracilis]
MGRPPCCDKEGIKKGPWTPEEDIILVSYVQQHGPGNWRSVPSNTGLLRCSKSCRLRWTNYLRPGIKRGNFTPHEEGMIIHLQALLGNKWAAIASYLPKRTDNDIKNYWNTHLKKKLNEFQSAGQLQPHMPLSSDHIHGNAILQGHDHHDGSPEDEEVAAIQISSSTITNTSAPRPSTYASSTENISRLLQGWMRSTRSHGDDHAFSNEEEFNSSNDLPFNDACSNDGMNTNADHAGDYNCDDSNERKIMLRDSNDSSSNPPLTFLEKWLLDETSAQIEETMALSHMF